MPAPPVEGTPVVVYVGPDSDGVAAAWTGDGLDLRAAEPGAQFRDLLTGERADCVVCYDDGTGTVDVSAVVSRVRAVDDEVPVVVFANGLDVGAAVDLDVTHHYAVDGTFDASARLEQLVPLIERCRRERRERSMLDSLLTNIPLSVYFKDRRSRHVRVSDQQPTLTGAYLENPEGKRHHTPEDVLGKTEHGLYPAENATHSVEVDEAVMETGESFHEIEHIDGGPLDGTFVSTFKAPWYDGDELVGTLGVTTDVTERKQYEHQLERQNERLERFASVISHDLRNPLEVAFARLEFARETGEAEHFDSCKRALDRMNTLIDDVLTLARQGETVDDPEPVALDSAVAEAWALVETPDASLDSTTDERILADPGRLQQLFENVFRNAVEHGSTSPRSQAPEDAVEHGGDDVTVTVGDLDDRAGFFVADDGPGIPPEDREAVLDSGFTTSDDGTGLGLSIVRTIAEAHGWRVTVTESESGGARFEFSQIQRPDPSAAWPGAGGDD